MKMKTFEQFVKPTTGYHAYNLSSASRQDLLRHFQPKYPEVVADHVTHKFPAKSDEELPPAAKEAHVIGYADSGDGIEAAVVRINGNSKRPDGKLYHITLSLDRSKGKKPVHSNDLVNKTGFKHVTPFPIHLEPAFKK